MFKKSIDQKFQDIGYQVASEDSYHITYRKSKDFNNYDHCITIQKNYDNSISISAYDTYRSTEECTDINTSLLFCEAKLCIKKIKELDRKYDWNLK